MAQDIIKHFPTIETVTEEMAKDFIAVTNKYIHDTGHCIVGRGTSLWMWSRLANSGTTPPYCACMAICVCNWLPIKPRSVS